MHLGQYNHHYDYTIPSGGTNTTLEETTNEKDLGVQVDHELKFDRQVEMVANKTNKMLGLMRTSFTYLDGPTIKKRSWSPITSSIQQGSVLGPMLVLQAQDSVPVEHPHRICCFITLIKYIQIKTRQILVHLEF